MFQTTNIHQPVTFACNFSTSIILHQGFSILPCLLTEGHYVSSHLPEPTLDRKWPQSSNPQDSIGSPTGDGLLTKAFLEPPAFALHLNFFRRSARVADSSATKSAERCERMRSCAAKCTHLQSL